MKGDESSDKQKRPRRKRKHDKEADAELRTRIKRVLAAARRIWPVPQKRPGFRTMANHIATEHGKELGFKFETIRQILKGTYPAMQELGISGL